MELLPGFTGKRHMESMDEVLLGLMKKSGDELDEVLRKHRPDEFFYAVVEYDEFNSGAGQTVKGMFFSKRKAQGFSQKQASSYGLDLDDVGSGYMSTSNFCYRTDGPFQVLPSLEKMDENKRKCAIEMLKNSLLESTTLF